MRRFLSSRECSCSPSSMVHCRPTLTHFSPPVNPCGTTPRPAERPGSCTAARAGATGSPTRTRPGSATAAWMPNGSGSVVSTLAAVGRRAPSACRDRRWPVSGFWVVIAQRPTLPCGTTTASPTWTRRPIQPSSSCASSPSIPKFMRKRRRSIRSTPSTPRERPERGRRRAASPRRRGRGRRRRSAATSRTRLADELRQRLVPRPGDDAERRAGARWKFVVELVARARPRRSTVVAVGEAQRQRVPRPRRSRRGRAAAGRASLVVDEPFALVDEEEAPVAAQAALEQLDLVECCERQRLDRRERDPGDARAHLANVSCAVVRAPPRDHGRARARARARSASGSVVAARERERRAPRRTSRPRRRCRRSGRAARRRRSARRSRVPPFAPSVSTTMPRVERAVVALARVVALPTSRSSGTPPSRSVGSSRSVAARKRAPRAPSAAPRRRRRRRTRAS